MENNEKTMININEIQKVYDYVFREYAKMGTDLLPAFYVYSIISAKFDVKPYESELYIAKGCIDGFFTVYVVGLKSFIQINDLIPTTDETELNYNMALMSRDN